MTYQIVKSQRRSIQIHIADGGEIMVRAPWWMPQPYIEQFVSKHQLWIKRRLTELTKRSTPSLLTMGQVQYLGTRYPLIFAEINENLTERLKRLKAEHWYKSQARELIHARIDHYKAELGVTPGLVSLRNQKSRWGSCSAKGNLSFSWRLIMAPSEIVDYVVVHELAHIAHHNHSKTFWALVAKACPQFKKHRQWLKVHGDQLRV